MKQITEFISSATIQSVVWKRRGGKCM